MTPVAAIVLAAGRGTRFGAAPKLLADFCGKPLVRHAVEAALASRASPVIVVLGHAAERVRAALDGFPVRFVVNPLYADGLATSLRAGFSALPADCAAAVILLGDMPLVGAPLVDATIAAWEEAGRPSAAAPVHGGQRGHPVLLSKILAGEIAALTGDAGAGRLLKAQRDVAAFPVDQTGALADIDTPDAIAALAKVAPRS